VPISPVKPTRTNPTLVDQMIKLEPKRGIRTKPVIKLPAILPAVEKKKMLPAA